MRHQTQGVQGGRDRKGEGKEAQGGSGRAKQQSYQEVREDGEDEAVSPQGESGKTRHQTFD